jgi:hypothetical protein
MPGISNQTFLKSPTDLSFDLCLNKKDWGNFSDKVIANDIVKKEKLHLVKKDKTIYHSCSGSKSH